MKTTCITGNERIGRARQNRARLRANERTARTAFARGTLGLSMAEYFRDEEQRDVLLFIDNIFRFYAGRCRARLSSAAFRRLWDTNRLWLMKWDRFRNALPSTTKGSITSVPVSRASRRLHRSGANHLRPPRLDYRAYTRPLRTWHLPGCRSAGFHVQHSLAGHCRTGDITTRRAVCRKCCSGTKNFRTLSLILGMEELSEDDKRTVQRARKVQRYLFPTFLRRRNIYRHSGQFVAGQRKPSAFKAILNGDLDDVPEQAFYMKGGIDEVNKIMNYV